MMIRAGSFINLTTLTKDKSVYYARVQVVSISTQTLTIRYVAKTAQDEKTKKLKSVYTQESMPRRHVIKMRELL